MTRHLTYDKVFNLRDLGGYEAADGRVVRWRTLFRGDGAHRLAHDAFVELGIRTALDLRTPGEIERGRIEVDDVDWHHLPVIVNTWEASWVTDDIAPERFLADRYLAMLEEGGASLGTALQLLSDPQRLPALFHCAAGKDRTGVLAALVLDLLGVDEATVAHDYGLSRLGMDRLIEFVRLNYPERVDTMADQPKVFMDAPEAAMRLFLHDLRERYGSVEEYVATVGVGPDVVEALRDTLLSEE